MFIIQPTHFHILDTNVQRKKYLISIFRLIIFNIPVIFEQTNKQISPSNKMKTINLVKDIVGSC